MAGLVGFQDPPRSDSASLISRIKELGIRVVMITGDGLLTAKAIAAKIGIGDCNCAGETLNDAHWTDDEGCEVYAEVLNILDSHDKDMAYWYEAYIPTFDAAPVEGRLSRVVEPRTLRVGLKAYF